MIMHRPATAANHDHFLPNFCNIRWVLACILMAELLAFLLELASTDSEYGFWSDLGLRSLFILWIALTSEALLCGLRRSLCQLNDIHAGILAFLVIQAMTVTVSWMALDLLPHQGLSTDAAQSNHPAAFYFRTVGISSIVAAVLLRYLYVQHQWKAQVKAQTETRLAVLQSRIRPHFLFNSLNTIAHLIRSAPDIAEELVQDLAELFRASLKTDAKLVSLASELVLIKQYLHIEMVRLGPRLRVEWDLDAVPRDTLVPPLSLQPLVENAVYHGIESAQDGGIVLISGHKRNEHVVVIIRNSLPKQHLERGRQGNRMAIDNVRARIQGCFPSAGRVFISTTDEFYQVRVIVPYRTVPS
jgi:two-component system, LytTR family, sensor histidine kinase AlgZ